MIDINKLISEGASDDVILKAIESNKAEKRALDQKKKAELEREAKSKEKDNLKAEARAYVINALIAYSEAFDLLDEDETWEQEDIDKMEQLLIKVEDMIPMYIKLAQMQDKLNEDFGGMGFGFGGFKL